MPLKIKEYRPGFVDMSDERKESIVNCTGEIKDIPWLKNKGTVIIDGCYVKSYGSGYVMAIIEEIKC
jgi:hypothetical protein